MYYLELWVPSPGRDEIHSRYVLLTFYCMKNKNTILINNVYSI